MTIEEKTFSALRHLVSIKQQESTLVLEDLEQQKEPHEKKQKVRPSLDSNWLRRFSTETLEKQFTWSVFGCRWTRSLLLIWPQWNKG